MRFDILAKLGMKIYCVCGRYAMQFDWCQRLDVTCSMHFRLVSAFGCNLQHAFSTLNIEAAIFSGTVVPVNRTEWQYVLNPFVCASVLDLCMR